MEDSCDIDDEVGSHKAYPNYFLNYGFEDMVHYVEKHIYSDSVVDMCSRSFLFLINKDTARPYNLYYTSMNCGLINLCSNKNNR